MLMALVCCERIILHTALQCNLLAHMQLPGEQLSYSCSADSGCSAAAGSAAHLQA
jgi:hypothetical protein